MIGVERRSCYSLKDMLEFGYNVLMYPLPSCGFQSLKCYSVTFHMVCIIGLNFACENVLLKTSPSFPLLLSSNHLPLPKDQSSYLQDEFSANTTSTANTTTLLHTTYQPHHIKTTPQIRYHPTHQTTKCTSKPTSSPCSPPPQPSPPNSCSTGPSTSPAANAPKTGGTMSPTKTTGPNPTATASS